MPRGKKKIVLPESITPIKELDFRGMSQEEIAGSLGLPLDANLKQIRKAALEEAGLKGTRRSKNQEFTEAERKAKKEADDKKKKKKRADTGDYFTAIGIPKGKPRGGATQTTEEKKARRKSKRDANKKERDMAKAFVLQKRKEMKKKGDKIPLWMQNLK